MAILQTLLFSLYICSLCSNAEVICKPLFPRSFLPSLASCNYAIKQLETINEQCGASPVIWTAQPGGFGAFRLPLMFPGQGPDYTPPTRVWCVISVQWQPREGSSMPPPTQTDIFPFNAVLYSARRIRNICLLDRPGSPPMLGKEWVKPHEWIDVQLGIMLEAPRGAGYRDVSAIDDGMMTMLLADGTHRTVKASEIHETRVGCGNLTVFGGGTVGNIQ